MQKRLRNNLELVKICMYWYGVLGEAVNTPDCDSGMHGFDPHRAPHIYVKLEPHSNGGSFSIIQE